MSNKILAFIEFKDSKFKSNAFEVISEAKKLSENLNCEFSAISIGNNPEQELTALREYGLKKVFYADSEELNSIYGEKIIYSPSVFSKTISEFAIKNNYNIILLSATSLGREISPSIAVRTNSAISPDVTEIFVTENDINTVRPVYAGKALCVNKSNISNIVITIRPNVFKPVKKEIQNTEIIKLDVKDFNITKEDFRTTVKEILISSEKLDVAEAGRIVSGGRGLRNPENFHLIESLASVIGAATGASRAVVDAGWRPHSEQVGQTGKTVSPDLYIACGISGAIQHLAGMSSSKYIVAINKDPEAPIFQIADYGIIGDVMEVLPALTEEFRKLMMK